MKNAHAALKGLLTLLLIGGGIGFIAQEAHGQSDDEKEVAGVVEAVDAQNNVLTVDGVTYTVTGTTEYEGTNGLSGLSSGEEVEIEYEETTSGREALEVETTNADDEEDEENEVSGAVDAVGDRMFTIDGTDYTVTSQTKFEGLSGWADLSPGDEIEVEYEEMSLGREVVEVETAQPDEEDEARK